MSSSRHSQPRAPLLLVGSAMAVSFFVGGILLSLHTPTRFSVNSPWLKASYSPQRSVVHFAADDCPCSRRLLNYLEARGLKDGYGESVIYFGPANAQLERLERIGFQVESGATAEASGVLAAPWVVIRDSQGHVDYSGGYEHEPYWENRILFELEAGRVVASRPTTGCYTSAKLREASLAYRFKSWIERSGPYDR